VRITTSDHGILNLVTLSPSTTSPCMVLRRTSPKSCAAEVLPPAGWVTTPPTPIAPESSPRRSPAWRNASTWATRWTRMNSRKSGPGPDRQERVGSVSAPTSLNLEVDVTRPLSEQVFGKFDFGRHKQLHYYSPSLFRRPAG